MKLIILIFLFALLVSGCIEAVTFGLQANDQGPDNENRWASEQGIDNADSELVDQVCRIEFEWGSESTAEACDSLKVNVDGIVYNCKFNEEKNICET